MIPSSLRERAISASTAVGDMPADSYCPKRPGERRIDCLYCVAEFATDAILTVVETALAEARAAGRAEALRPFEELFAGGPDTACRTTWQENPSAPNCSAASIECVEVPMADLRAAFAAAKGDPADCGLCNVEGGHQPWCPRAAGVLA